MYFCLYVCKETRGILTKLIQSGLNSLNVKIYRYPDIDIVYVCFMCKHKLILYALRVNVKSLNSACERTSHFLILDTLS